MKILIMNRIFQRATQRPRILLTDNIQSGAAGVSTITSLILVARFPVDRDCKTKTGFLELFIFLSCRSLDTAPNRQIVHSLATYFLRKGLTHSSRKFHSHHWTWLHQVHNDFPVRLNLQ